MTKDNFTISAEKGYKDMDMERAGIPVLIILLALCISGCRHSGSAFMDGPKKVASVSLYEGKVVSDVFVNKVGRENPKIIDLYFEIEGERYFIKFIDSTVKRKEISGYAGRELKVRASLSSGLWDTNDPNTQSRVGKYIVIYEIVQ